MTKNKRLALGAIAAVAFVLLLVCFRFVSCENKPQYNEVTKQEIYDALKELYPNAEIDFDEHELRLNKNGDYPKMGNYWIDLESKAIPEEFSFEFIKEDKVETIDEIKTVINCFMKLFYNDWSEYDMSKFFIKYEFTDDDVIEHGKGLYKFKDTEIKAWYNDNENTITIYINN